jgi:MFS family permease
MGEEPTTAEKMRRLPWSLAGNSANAVFSQLTFFGSVFVLFLSQLGLSTSTIGFLLSLIPFFGLVALFVAPTVARVGYKRVYITGFTLRKIVTLGLLLAPWVLAQYGPRVLLWSIIAILSLFSLLRAIAITASHPWEQEYIPDSVRGKYAAANQIVTGITGFLAVTAAGAFLGPDPALRDFGVLFVVGTAAGLVSMWAYVQVPGGAPQPASQADSASHRGLFQAARDPNLSYFLAGIGLVTLASTGLGSFVPLFMRDTVGLTAGQVVGLQSATMVGGLLTSFAWGWAADRYGSRPVTLLGLYLKAVLPIFWFVMPGSAPWRA